MKARIKKYFPLTVMVLLLVLVVSLLPKDGATDKSSSLEQGLSKTIVERNTAF